MSGLSLVCQLLLSLACLSACLPFARAQVDPSALTMAKTIVDTKAFNLVTSGPDRPTFSGPAGSAKLITYWAANAPVEKDRMPKGAVKLVSSGTATIKLKFSAISKVTIVNGHFC
jgi:hypothetical protein